MPNAWPLEDTWIGKSWLPLRHTLDSSWVPWTCHHLTSPQKGDGLAPAPEIIRWKVSPEPDVFSSLSWTSRSPGSSTTHQDPDACPQRTCLFTGPGAKFALKLACHTTCSQLVWDWSLKPNQSFLPFSFVFLNKQELTFLALAEGQARRGDLEMLTRLHLIRTNDGFPASILP